MTKTELKAEIAKKEAELKELKAQLKAIQEKEKASKVEEVVNISIDLDKLEECNTREEAREMLKDLKVKELKEISKKYYGKCIVKNKKLLINEIIEIAIGNKIEEMAIMG